MSREQSLICAVKQRFIPVKETYISAKILIFARKSAVFPQKNTMEETRSPATVLKQSRKRGVMSRMNESCHVRVSHVA